MRKKNIFKEIKSFNLIELMIVVIVIGILSAIAIPKFQQAIEEAKFKEAQAVLKAIRNAEKVFKAERGVYVGVNIDESDVNKRNWWTMLNIQEVADVPNEWSYGVNVRNPGGCNAPPGDWGDDPQNEACVPFARRESGVEINEVMHIQMTDGTIIGTGPNPGPGELRANLTAGGVLDCPQQR
ncbi:MAG: prepilin-type N-terminal cleavage/methylation domain-containing protein [Candidatus Omnitrophota bacterium]